MSETLGGSTNWNAVKQVAGAHATGVADLVARPVAREEAIAAAAPLAAEAKSSADLATVNATQTSADASASVQARGIAEVAALRAGNAAAISTATANIFTSVEAGLAATAEGLTFPVQAEGSVLTTIYRKTNGEAVYVGQVASKAAIDKALARFLPDSRPEVIFQPADRYGFGLDFAAYVAGGLTTKTFRHNAPGGPKHDASVDKFGFVQTILREDSFQAFGVKLAATGSRASITAADGLGINLEGSRFIERPLPPGVTLASIDRYGFGMLSIGTSGIVANLVSPNNPEPIPVRVPDLAPLYSGSLFLLPGQKLSFYPRNLFRLRSDAAYAEVTFDSAGYVVSGRGDSEMVIEADRCGTTGTLTIARRDIEDLNRLSIALTVRKAVPAGQTPRLLMIGDSICNRQLGVLTRTVLAAVGINPVYVGTVPSTSGAASSTDSGGPPGESREGRGYADLVYSVLDGEAAPLPVGQEAAYLAMSKADKLPYNPFIRAATGGDPAGLVRNGYVFDFRFYLDRFTIPDPDILWLALGENDVIENLTLAAAAASVADALPIVLQQARAAVPAMRIGVALSGQPSTPDGEARWEKKAAVLATIISTVRALNDPLIHLVPTWAHVSPSAGWTRSAGTTDGLGVTASIVNDNIHPIGSARQQLADATAAFIAAVS